MEPKRSAMAPTKGCAVPQTMTWIASASENTSRLQPLAADIGVRNRPSAARGPKPMAPIRQPQTRITIGVRQAPAAAALRGADCTAMLWVPGSTILYVSPPIGVTGAWTI